MARRVVRGLKMLGLLPASLVLTPLLFGGGLGLVFAIAGTLLATGEPLVARVVAIKFELGWLLVIVAGVVGLAAAWGAVILGPDRVLRERGLRVLVPVGLIIGLVVGVVWLAWMEHNYRTFAYTQQEVMTGWATWGVVTALPMMIGGLELYGLLAGAIRRSRSAG